MIKIVLFVFSIVSILSARVVNLSPITSTSTSTTVTYISTPPPPNGGGGSGGSGSSSSGSSTGGGGSSTPAPTHISIVDFEIFGEEDAKDGQRMKFNIAFSKPLSSSITIPYTITPNEITLGSDIKQGANNSITLSSGTRSAYIYVDVIDDNKKENAEYFTIRLSKPSGNYKLDNDKSIGVIIDNEIEYDTNSTTGDYAIYEYGTTNSNIDTKIVDKPTKLDIYASSGFEVAHSQGQHKSTNCSAPVCTTSGNTKTCTKTCTITITPYIEYSDKMDIDRVVMYRAKEYDSVNKKCIDPKMLTISRKHHFKSGDGPFSVDIPTDGAFRCAWIEVWGQSATDMNTHKAQILHGKSDVFAIRPKEFKIEKISSPIVSATNFDLKIYADSWSSNHVKYYNQKQNSTTKIDIVDKKYGILDIDKNGFIITGYDFVDGIITKSIKYNEVGEVDVKVSENPSNYFAMVDGTNSYIKPATETFTFIPANFSVSYDANQYKNGADFAFIANSFEMFSKLHLDIKALNADGDVTKRYDKNGYADQTKVDFTQYINGTTMKNLFYKAGITNSNTDINSTSQTLSVTFDSDVFQNGQMLEDIEESFKRVSNQPQNPIELTTTKIDIQDNKYTSVTGTKTQNSSSKHYYGRVHVAPDPVEAVGTNLDANIYYEVYCKSCDKSNFTLANNKASVDSIYWYIIPSIKYTSKNICDIDSSTVDVINHDSNIINVNKVASQDKINVKIHSAPYKNKVVYSPSYSYLLFDRIDPAVTKHSFVVRFLTGGANWAGEGRRGSVVDTNISENSNNNIDW